MKKDIFGIKKGEMRSISRQSRYLNATTHATHARAGLVVGRPRQCTIPGVISRESICISRSLSIFGIEENVNARRADGRRKRNLNTDMRGPT